MLDEEEEFEALYEDDFDSESVTDPYGAPGEDEYEVFLGEDDFDAFDPEGDEFLGALGGIAKKLAPLAKRHAGKIGGLIGGAIGGPAGAAIGGKLGGLVLEDDFDSEDEMEAAMPIAPVDDSLAESMASAAAKSSPADAQALGGAFTLTIMSKTPIAVKSVAPGIASASGRIARSMTATPASRQLIKVLPTVIRRTAATLNRKAQKGKPITRATAARVMTKHAKCTLDSEARLASALAHRMVSVSGSAITQMGDRLAYQARDAADLGRLVRQQFGSHLLQNDSDAQKLADAAFTAFAKRHKSNDTDYAWMMGQAIAKEYRDMVAGRRRSEVAARAGAMAKDPIFRERVAWREKVQALANEFGLDYQVVEAVLMEYNQANMPRHAGIIDPRQVPFLQVQAPLVRIAKIINFMTLGSAGSFASFVTGVDMDGKQLSSAERILEGVLAVISFASPGGGNLISGIAQIGKLGFTSIKAILLATRGLARAAATSGVGMRAFLRLLSHLRHIDPKKVAALLKRMKEARAARNTLRLTDGEASLMREIDNAFREHSLPTARVVKIAKTTARTFMFLNRRQPLVLGRCWERHGPLPRSG